MNLICVQTKTKFHASNFLIFLFRPFCAVRCRLHIHLRPFVLFGGRFWVALGLLLRHSWADLGLSWVALGFSWAALKDFLAALGLLLGCSWPLWDRSAALLAAFGPCLATLGSLLGHQACSQSMFFSKQSDRSASKPLSI